MARAQIISMDFIMAFIIFMGAISIFFYSYQSNIRSSNFKIDPKTTFSKLANMENSFLSGARLVNFDEYIIDYESLTLHEILKGTENANYCIYLQNGTKILRNFEAVEGDNNIFFGDKKCGEVRFTPTSEGPICMGKEAIIITKPVVFNGGIMSLNVLACEK